MPYSGNIFSADDESYSNRNHLNGYVGIKNGQVNTWAKWTASGTVGTQTNFSNKQELQKGC